MITYDCTMSKDGDNMIGDFTFKGLSTDTKPTRTIDGIKIKNGSSFFEMNTQNVKFYDASSDVWV